MDVLGDSEMDLLIQPTYELLESTPIVPKSSDPEAEESARHIGTASYLNTLLSNSVQILSKYPVEHQSLRDLGRGGTFQVCNGKLSHNLDSSKYIMGPTAGDQEPPSKGQSVALKHINPEELESKQQKFVDLAPLATEIAILSHRLVRPLPQIASLIGVGWQSSPYDDSESPQHWPYLVTEFGSRGNLDEYFRYYHRKHSKETRKFIQPDKAMPDLKGPVQADWEAHMAWEMKITIVWSLANALNLLHLVGVVHGDVKFSNVVANIARTTEESEDVEFMLCDFGSSILYSDYEDENTECKLVSLTKPWDAPEASRNLRAKETFATDMYSFGLFFARVMLDGNDPFDESFHVATGQNATYNMQEVERLKAEDKVGDLSISRIKSLGIYSSDQLNLIETIIHTTVVTDPLKRAATMQPISGTLQEVIHSDDPGEYAWPITKQRWFCLLYNRWNVQGYFEKEYSREGFSTTISQVKRSDQLPNVSNHPIPRILTPVREELLSYSQLAATKLQRLVIQHSIMQEVFLDFKRIAEPARALTKPSNASLEAAYQLAMCLIHGWGTEPSPMAAIEWLDFSAKGGDRRAQACLLAAHDAFKWEVSEDLIESVLPSLASQFIYSNMRVMAESIKRLAPELYWDLIKEARTYRVDMVGTRRFLIADPESVTGASSEVEKGIEFPPELGWTRLHYACMSGQVSRVQQVLSQEGADIEARNFLGQTPLWIACNSGHTEIVRLLLEAGADPMMPDTNDGLTPFHFLSRFDPDDIGSIAQQLADAGADINAVTNRGVSPLDYVLDDERNFSAGTELPAVFTLLELNASPNGSLDLSDVNRQDFPDCPLARAIAHFRPQIFLAICQRIEEGEKEKPQESCDPSPGVRLAIFHAKCFLVGAAKPAWFRIVGNGSDYPGSIDQILKHLLSAEVRLLTRSSVGSSPLEIVCSGHAYDLASSIIREKLFDIEDLKDPELLSSAFATRNLDLVLQLEEAGLDLSSTHTTSGENFLHLAAKHCWKVSDLQKLCDTIQANIDPHALAKETDGEQSTPFELAVILGSLHLAEFISKFGIDVNSEHFQRDIFGHRATTSILGRCLFMDADMALKVRRVRYLLKFDPALQVSSSNGRTAFHLIWPKWANQRKKHISPETKDAFSNTILDLLLDHYPTHLSINQPDFLGITPLHVAAGAGNLPGVKRLLECGANVNALDNGAQTPLDVIGDRFFQLAASWRRHEVNPSDVGGDQLSLLYSDIEWFIYLEATEVLRKWGGLSGVECIARGAEKRVISPESEGPERAYNVFKKHFKFKNPPAVHGQTLKLGVIPPKDRKDLGHVLQSLHVDLSSSSSSEAEDDDNNNNDNEDDEDEETLVLLNLLKGFRSEKTNSDSPITAEDIDTALKDNQNFQKVQDFMLNIVWRSAPQFNSANSLSKEDMRRTLSGDNLRPIVCSLLGLDGRGLG